MGLFAGTPFDLPPRCERCEKLESECTCPPLPPKHIPPEKQTAKLRIEKRAKGKYVTVIAGLAAESNDLPALLASLKNACGAGGSLQPDALEVQGDHLVRVRKHLEQLGYRVKG
ncbi:MAG: translation initiation factor [Pirellulales bacterium]